MHSFTADATGKLSRLQLCATMRTGIRTAVFMARNDTENIPLEAFSSHASVKIDAAHKNQDNRE